MRKHLTGLKKKVVCHTCTLKLITLVYRRALLFRLVRKPLKGGMRGLAWIHRIDPAEYEVRNGREFWGKRINV